MQLLRNNIAFIISLFIVLFFVGVGIASPQGLFQLASYLEEKVIELFGWGYLIAAFVFIIFNVYLAASKFGRIKLGKDHEKPQYSYFGWFSMLFAAGMGIGMIFWGVAEPMSHYLSPAGHVTPESEEAARFAMRYSFFHWGLQPWAIYITMSLGIAYFSFRRGMPPLISSCFYPLIRDRIYTAPGYIIDSLAVFATVFGVVTSLGLGAMQINSGLGAVFPFEATFTTTVIIIAVVTVLFLISSLSGLDRGIQILSKTNIMLAIILMGFMLAAGPTVYILSLFLNTLSDYLASLFQMSLSTNHFRGHEWTQAWTMFYWAWWISWSPFVGLFVASISRGRTIREFVSGALLVPTLLTFLWFSVFGGSAFHVELTQQAGFAETVAGNISLGLFELYEFFPLGILLSLITITLLGIFFITSADSATYVLSMMTSRGRLVPPASKKITWGLIISGTSIILLYSGGLEALQKMAITAALPFTVIMLFICRSLGKGLNYEFREQSDNPYLEGQEKDSE